VSIIVIHVTCEAAAVLDVQEDWRVQLYVLMCRGMCLCVYVFMCLFVYVFMCLWVYGYI
jgi:hypothetical protein